MSTFINRLFLLLAFYVQHFPTYKMWCANISCPPLVSVIPTPLFRGSEISEYTEIHMIIFLLSNPLYYKQGISYNLYKGGHTMNTNILIEERYIDILISNGIANPVEHLKNVIDEYMKEYILEIELDKELKLDLNCLNELDTNSLNDLDLKLDNL